MCDEYLYDDVGAFVQSPMWTGDKAYAQEPIRPWFGWLYIAEFNGLDIQQYITPDADMLYNLKFKIGMTLNIAQRTAELEKTYKNDSGTQSSASIIYAWSVPRPFTFELKVKRFLKAFIIKESLPQDMAGRSETIHGLTLMPLLRVIQLCILEQCLALGYIRVVDRALKRHLTARLRSPCDLIVYKRQKYVGQKLALNVVRKFDIDRATRVVGALEYPSSFDSDDDSDDDAHFVQYVFDYEDLTEDHRVPNHKLRDDPGTIANDGYGVDPSGSGITDPFVPDDCVFAQYVDTNKNAAFYPARVKGYGTGTHTGFYVIEFLEFHTASNGDARKIDAYPTDPVTTEYVREKDGASGEPIRAEYKHPRQIKSWRAMGVTQPTLYPERWPTVAQRKQGAQKEDSGAEDEDSGAEEENGGAQKAPEHPGMTPQQAKSRLEMGTRVKKVTDAGEIVRGTIETVTKIPDVSTTTGRFGIRNGMRIQNPKDWEIVDVD